VELPGTAIERSQGEGEVDHLILLSQRDNWHPSDLPWAEGQGAGALQIADGVCLVARLPAFRKMSPVERDAIKCSELAAHLSTLAFGEERAVDLAGDTVSLCPVEDANARWFLGTLLADEAKHFVALRRYLARTFGEPVVPHGPLARVFQQLRDEKDYALNLLVGQIVLEGAAASLLASLLISTREPLLRELLKRISRDEARHMKFAHLAVIHAEALSAPRRRRMEEVLFEAAHAALASLLAERTWSEVGVPRAEARAATVDALRERGVLTYYSRVIARQIARRGFPVEALARSLETRLEQRLRTT
jgi:hypothetical protein